MKKIKIYILFISLIALIGCSQKDTQDNMIMDKTANSSVSHYDYNNAIEESQEDRPDENTNLVITDSLEAVLSLYSDFMNNESTVEFDEDQYMDIKQLLFDSEEERLCYQYCLFDMTGDDIPELILRARKDCEIYMLTGKNSVLSVWWQDRFWSGYSILLDNGDVFHIRGGAAPTHTTYHYVVFDEDGEYSEHIIFEKYDVDEDGEYDDFTFENVGLSKDKTLSKEEWDKITEPYFSYTEMEWNEYTGTISLTNETYIIK